MDYVSVPKEKVGCLLDVEVRKGARGMSYYFLIEGRLKLNTT